MEGEGGAGERGVRRGRRGIEGWGCGLERTRGGGEGGGEEVEQEKVEGEEEGRREGEDERVGEGKGGEVERRTEEEGEEGTEACFFVRDPWDGNFGKKEVEEEARKVEEVEVQEREDLVGVE